MAEIRSVRARLEAGFPRLKDGNASGRMLHASELLRVLEASIAGKPRSYYILRSHQHTSLLLVQIAESLEPVIFADAL